MQVSLTSEFSSVAVFAQGILSFFSPCVLPLLPVYFGYLSGGTGERLEDGTLRFNRGRVLVNTLFFAAGISVAFFLLGLGMSALGTLLTAYQKQIMQAGGVLMILFGLYQMDLLGSWGFLAKERKLPFRPEQLAASPFTAFILGFVFSFAWTPCVGPMLSSVLILAAAEPQKGMVMILLYTAGFVIPFLLVGLFSGALLSFFNKHKGVVAYTVKAGGLLMVALGLLLFTGRLHGTGAAASQAGQEPAAQHQVSDAAGKGKPGTKPAIPFTLRDQYGKTHQLSDYRGKVIFLNFWATWCPPCRAEMPDIQKLYERSPKEGKDAVIVLGVATPGLGNEKDEKGIKAFMDKNKYTYPVLMDTKGELFTAYGIRAIPTTYMIDRKGNLFGVVRGALSAENMENIVRQTQQQGAE